MGLREIRALAVWKDLIDDIQAKSIYPEKNSLGLMRAAHPAVLAELYSSLQRPILFLTDKQDNALLSFDEIHYWNEIADRRYFPAPEPLFYEQAAWGHGVNQERIITLDALAELQIPGGNKPDAPPLIIASIRAAMTRTSQKDAFFRAFRTLRLGQEANPDWLMRHLVAHGYSPADTVLDSGQCSKRGGLLDLWPFTEAYPLRIDFFGDEIDAIYRFDANTQRNIAKLNKIVIPPATEAFPRNANDLRLIPEGATPEFFIPQLHPQPTCLLDYLPKNAVIVFDDWNNVKLHAEELEEQGESLRKRSVTEGTLTEDFPLPYVSFSEIQDRLDGFAWINLGHSEDIEKSLTLAEHFSPAQRFNGNIQMFMDFLLDRYMNQDQVIALSRQASRIQGLWDRTEIDPQSAFSPKIKEISLASGFVFETDQQKKIFILSDNEIFGWARPVPGKPARQVSNEPEKFYADLKPGDFVVHIDYGIGQYADLVTRTIDGIFKDFLCIQYAHGDQLYVPVHQADRLTNYIGPDGRKPELTRLGTQDWLTTRNHVKESALEVANDLLELYAERQVSKGFAFAPDNAWQADMENAFPYVETEDQKLAIKKVKEDMESSKPMDRLICGDVGYGKTEIAIRAAFKATCSGKQVAIMVPTTVLAQQHYDTFKNRFSAFPVKVEMLSRFRSEKQQKEILKELKNGSVDVVIGTHRLISKDVKFKDLGLVIIDEEQRFGVAHKEHLKKLRNEVDVLTMTATPIPRTLYMALTGVRDISNINTPPSERVPIITHVGPYSEKLIRQAIMRELERNGQVFFVHNRVHTIYAMEKHLQSIVPEARIGVGHGQLPEKQLESVMEAFYSKNIDVLLCTSIIESGLDVPNANTLIVDRAETFGLAQLYQIRGRVGRSSQRAYAYFFRSKNVRPTEEGLERLEVVAENSNYGAGYTIAMRDLEMRGAGDILGVRQHGAIASVGFHLYTRMLAQAVRGVKESKGIEISDEDIGITKDMAYIFNPITVELPLDIGIPEAYVPDQKTRIKIYRRMASVHDELSLNALEEEFRDRFGPIPGVVLNLFFQIRVKIRAEKMGLAGVTREGENVVLRFPSLAEGVSSRNLPEAGGGIRPGKNAYWLTMIDFDDAWQQSVLDALELIEDRLEMEKRKFRFN